MSPYYCLVQVVSHCNNTHHEKFTLQHCVKFSRTWSFVFLIDTAEILSTMHFPCITAVLDIDRNENHTNRHTLPTPEHQKPTRIHTHTQKEKSRNYWVGFFCHLYQWLFCAVRFLHDPSMNQRKERDNTKTPQSISSLPDFQDSLPWNVSWCLLFLNTSTSSLRSIRSSLSDLSALSVLLIV